MSLFLQFSPAAAEAAATAAAVVAEAKQVPCIVNHVQHVNQRAASTSTFSQSQRTNNLFKMKRKSSCCCNCVRVHSSSGTLRYFFCIGTELKKTFQYLCHACPTRRSRSLDRVPVANVIIFLLN
jgi:hypothetical protein